MHNIDYVKQLESRGIRATATRLLIYRTLWNHRHALSLRELTEELDSVDRSTIFRTLTLLLTRHLIHAIEDGTGVTKYEPCEGGGTCSAEDQHIHFFCAQCHRTFCFHSIHVPAINLPEGFKSEGVNYLVKGHCPDCLRHTPQP